MIFVFFQARLGVDDFIDRSDSGTRCTVPPRMSKLRFNCGWVSPIVEKRNIHQRTTLVILVIFGHLDEDGSRA